jgi:predicted nucleic acid-binding protein
MRDPFFDARPPSGNELDRLWDEATFVFDTNVLLDLYTLTPSTRQNFLDAFEQLQDRLFLPHQVVVEVARNRESKIRQAQSPFDTAREKLEEWVKDAGRLRTLKNQLEDLKGVREDALPFDYIDDALEGVVEDAAASIREKIDQAEEEHPVAGEDIPAPGDDPILQRLFDVFEGRTGEGYEQARYEQILDEADVRAERETPPGYADLEGDKRGDHQYGDQILWNQILDYASEHDVDILLVTDDSSKGDWFEDDEKVPRDELWREFQRRTGQRFWMVRPGKFLAEVKERFDLDVSDESIEEAEVATSGTFSLARELKQRFDALFESQTIDLENLWVAREYLMRAWKTRHYQEAELIAHLMSEVFSEYGKITGIDEFGRLSLEALKSANALRYVPDSPRLRDALYELEASIQRARELLREAS